MTALSSFRALADNAEVASNQIRAITSWRKAFNRVVLVGEKEPLLDSEHTEFVDGGDFPRIRTLALIASFENEMTCLINSDIMVSPSLPRVINEVVSKGGQCATSHRYEFNPNTMNLSNAKVVDNGIDFFCATPNIWKIIVREIPATYRLGHAAWDTWMMGFFNTTRSRTFYDITKRRCIFHPLHQSRKRVHEIFPVQDKYCGDCGFPRLKI